MRSMRVSDLRSAFIRFFHLTLIHSSICASKTKRIFYHSFDGLFQLRRFDGTIFPIDLFLREYFLCEGFISSDGISD